MTHLRLSVDKHRCRGPRQRCGMALVYVAVIMSAMLALCSLAVDYARVQLIKTELQSSVDAAARYATFGLSDGTYLAKAQSSVAENSIDCATLSLQASDVGSGNYSAGVYTAGASPFNAVRINAQLSTARGNAVPLLFARILGANNCDIHATATAYAPSSKAAGIVGLNYIATHSGFFAASYNSSVTTSPSQSVHNNNCAMQTNGTLGFGGVPPGYDYGDATIGTGGMVSSSVTVSGNTHYTSPIPSVADPSMTPVTNPGGIGSTFNYGNGLVTTAPGGTYYLTSLSLGNDCTIAFSGAATILMNGNFTVGDRDSFIAYNNIPSNLVIYQASGTTFSAHDNFNFVGSVQGASATFIAHDHLNLEGSLYMGSVTFHDYDNVFFDEQLVGNSSGKNISLLQ